MGAMPFACLGRKPTGPGDDAVPVGAIPMRATTTAMRVAIEGARPIYVDEQPLWVATAWRVLEDGASRSVRWWRLEAKLASGGKAAKPGHHVVVAEHPYANGWVQVATLKRASKGNPGERAFALEKKLEAVGEPGRALDELDFDYWETGNYLTAGISSPTLPFSELDDTRNAQKNGLFVFGLCENFEVVEKAILLQPEIGQLILATERGTIKFWSPDAKLNAIPQLRDEVKEDRWSLMCLSIRQSLAGPHKDGGAWVGRPVAAKVDQIYRGHLNRRNRIVADKNRHIGELEGAGDREGQHADQARHPAH